MSTFIKLDRQIVSWQWWGDPVTSKVFIYLLLEANWKDGYLKGVLIKRGQVLRTLGRIADDNNFSVQQVRTALNRLKSTQEITNESTRLGTLVTIEKYNDYQGGTSESNTNINTAFNNELTSEQQKINKRSTTYKKNKNNKNNSNINNYSSEREINKERESQAILSANHDAFREIKERLMQA